MSFILRSKVVMVFFMATNRKIKMADDDIYEFMFSELDETRTKELTEKYECELLKNSYHSPGVVDDIKEILKSNATTS